MVEIFFEFLFFFFFPSPLFETKEKKLVRGGGGECQVRVCPRELLRAAGGWQLRATATHRGGFSPAGGGPGVSGSACAAVLDGWRRRERTAGRPWVGCLRAAASQFAPARAAARGARPAASPCVRAIFFSVFARVREEGGMESSRMVVSSPGLARAGSLVAYATRRSAGGGPRWRGRQAVRRIFWPVFFFFTFFLSLKKRIKKMMSSKQKRSSDANCMEEKTILPFPFLLSCLS